MDRSIEVPAPPPASSPHPRLASGAAPARAERVPPSAPGAIPFAELAARWTLARRSALATVLGALEPGEASEDLLVARAGAADLAALLRAVYDNSLTLGAGCARHHRAELTLGELPAAAHALGAPCLAGAWSVPSPGTARLERPGCPRASSAAVCDYWREAWAGLLVGLGGVLGARHQSLFRGGRCVDGFFSEPGHPLAFGPIPQDLARTLERVAKLVRLDPRASVRFRGQNEGVLFYELSTGMRPELEPRLRSTIEAAITGAHPRLSLRDITPRGVFDH